MTLDEFKELQEVLVQLTEAGKGASKKAYPQLVRADEVLNEVLSGQFENLKAQMENLNQQLQEVTK